MNHASTPAVYDVTVVFDYGARASIRTHALPTIPDAIWEPGSRCWIGDRDGPRLEIEGGHVVSMVVQRLMGADRSDGVGTGAG